jgi:thiamine-phosphate pyrophosphorylase
LFLYYITDRKQLSTDRDESARLILARIADAAHAGVDAIQLREKDLTARELVELGLRSAELVRLNSSSSRIRTRLLINSRVDVSIASGADGVHLRSDDVSAAEARAVFVHAGVSSPLIGVSCHTVQEVLLAEGQGADFAVYGPVFEKANQASETTGLAGLKEVCHRPGAAQRRMPVVALGGVDTTNAVNCLEAGASGVAGIRLFQNRNLIETVARLRAGLRGSAQEPTASPRKRYSRPYP